GDEAAEDAGLVHPPQRRLRILARGQDLEEEAVRLGILAQPRIDPLEVPRDEAQRLRMDVEIVQLRRMEEADEIDRILLEGVVPRDGEAPGVEREAFDLAPPEGRPAAPEIGR